MNQITVTKAGRTVKNKEIPDVEITIKDNPEVNVDHLTLRESQDFYTHEATRLFEAIRGVLPGATFDQLLCLMLGYKASHFQLPFESFELAQEIDDAAKSGLTDAQLRLVKLDLRKPEIKDYYETLEATLAQVEREIGVNGYFEAPDGTVYKITKPDGGWTAYKDLDFVRTKRDGERAGTLSAKEADVWRAQRDAAKEAPKAPSIPKGQDPGVAVRGF